MGLGMGMGIHLRSIFISSPSTRTTFMLCYEVRSWIPDAGSGWRVCARGLTIDKVFLFTSW